MDGVWFTADTHLGHMQTVQRFGRPFASVEQHNEAIITRINERVEKGDRLYHLGDIGWSHFDLQKCFLDRLKTKMVFAIRGNHDTDKQFAGAKFVWVNDLFNLKVGDARFVLCHYAMRSWDRRHFGSFHLYGHSHGKLPGEGRSMDVGVDTNNFYPWSVAEVIAKLDPIPFGLGDDAASRADAQGEG